MDKTLKTIEDELSWLIKDYKATTDYKFNKYLETLNYHIVYEKKKIKLIFQFLMMQKEESLVLKIIYDVKDAQRENHLYEFPLSKIRSNIELPMINDYDCQRIHDVMDYEVIDGQIKSTVSQLTQGLTYTEVIRRNIKDIIKYGRELRKKEAKSA
ncbi:hypothetical protein HF295_01830 [Hujiaoplasma nucleasis]|uniref:Uncharacterized protein n=1 Tax=Hujiaoplasma nucleasis TaxID=2725268 RepID=A0A7L6N372_9MOLU|nr:hypothetical protein [Hujiaoplasma nucleasis]QLY39668.1 hypothetical protein HF295_01830 [Hujiaoplasma nucleasis]